MNHLYRAPTSVFWEALLPDPCNPREPLRFGLRRLLTTFRIWEERKQSRRALESLSPRMLDDIGLTPEQAWIEARKPFWKN